MAHLAIDERGGSRRRWRLAALTVALALVLSGCAGATGGAVAPSPSGATSTIQATTLAALCDARSRAERGEGAAEVFAGAHGPLHDIARDLQDVDERAVAADLLEAKQRVEAAVDDESPPDDLPDRLSRLIDATRTSLDVLGVSAPACG